MPSEESASILSYGATRRRRWRPGVRVVVILLAAIAVSVGCTFLPVWKASGGGGTGRVSFWKANYFLMHDD